MASYTANRRDFLRMGSAFAAACTAIPYGLPARQLLAKESVAKNDRPSIAWIGAGDRGTFVAEIASGFGDIVAVCDVDRLHAEQFASALAPKADIYQDYRKLLERKDINVVFNATPDHWHTTINVAACRAGKDVYAEKPLTLTIEEGKLLSKVVESSGRVVQVGTQQRSSKQFQTAIELVRNGRIGTLHQVWVALPYYSTKGGPFSVEAAPPHLNWDMYQGQAPERPYCLQRTHQNFRWWYEYAGGITTDWGNHHMDIAHWGMDCEMNGPVSIEARGLFPNRGAPDCYNTADRFFARLRYPTGVELLYFSAMNQRYKYGDVQEHSTTTPVEMDWLFGQDVPDEIKSYSRDGIMFVGSEGRVFVNRGGVYGKAVEELQSNPLPADARRAVPGAIGAAASVTPADQGSQADTDSTVDHVANFFGCVKTREEPISPVRIQHRTITACHLTNISLRLGRTITWDPEAEQIVGDDEANKWQSRHQRENYTLTES